MARCHAGPTATPASMTSPDDASRWARTTTLSLLLALAALVAEAEAPGLALLGSLSAIAGLLAALVQHGEP